MSYFKHIRVSGDAAERGQQQGELLREEIVATLKFYQQRIYQFSELSEEALRERALRQAEQIAVLYPVAIDELDAMAAAAGVAPWLLYLLNSRTEILNASIGECTALCFPESKIIGQTWDWAKELSSLSVLVEHHYPDGRKLLGFHEAGMLGKIGINSNGLGICLNFLRLKVEGSGVPIHIISRAVLEADDFLTAQELALKLGENKSGFLLFADATGESSAFEFAGKQHFEVQTNDRALLHTNHYIAGEVIGEDPSIMGTHERLKRAKKIISNDEQRDMAKLKRVLVDRSDGNCSINAPGVSDATFGNLEFGTVAIVAMDLTARQLHIKGPEADDQFAIFTLS
tara:strand:- start:5645 stop:6673 length:1029 start_codon:yes stop_codon:yes gene_type:complete